MVEQRNIVIGPVDPRTAPIAAMIHELDRYMTALYPAESNHLADLDALTRPNVRFFAAAADQEYLGCGAIMIHGADYAEIKRLFVSPAARGLGLGKRILETLEAAARRERLPLLRLETGISQPEALRLFAACGFSRCGAFGDYPQDDAYSVFMQKRL